MTPARHAPIVAAVALCLASPAAAAGADLAALVRNAERPGTRIGIIARHGGRDLAAIRADERFPTASVAKLFTAAATLIELHPDGVLLTDVAFTGGRSDSLLRGDLVITGGGDPFLVTERCVLLAREVRARGIRAVAGKVILNEDRFGGHPFPSSWEEEPAGEPFQPFISPLGVNFNLVTVTVSAAAEAGRPAIVAVDPPLFFANRVVTARQGTPPSVSLLWKDTLQISGTIAKDGEPVTVRRRPPDYHPLVAAALKEAFTAAGVTVGDVVWGPIPPGVQPLLSFPSLPAKALVPLMLGYSNNFMAEVLLRELAARRDNVPGTTEGGASAATRILAAKGIPVDSLILADGSGLSRETRASPRGVVAVLEAMAKDWETGPAFLASLPLAGVEGTMEDRLGGDAYRRRVRAKTGSLAGISTLAGFLLDDRGRDVVFCLMIEGRPDAPLRDAERAIVDRLLAGL